MPQDKREIFNKVSFLRSMQAYADTHGFVKDLQQDPEHSQVSDDLILDPMAYLFPIGQEGLHK